MDSPALGAIDKRTTQVVVVVDMMCPGKGIPARPNTTTPTPSNMHKSFLT